MKRFQPNPDLVLTLVVSFLVAAVASADGIIDAFAYLVLFWLIVVLFWVFDARRGKA